MGASQVAQWLRESICQCMRCSCNSSVRRSLGVGTGNLPTTYYIILPSVRNKPDRRNPTSNNLYIVAAAAAKSLYLCLTLCDPIDSSPAGSSVPGYLTISSNALFSCLQSFPAPRSFPVSRLFTSGDQSIGVSLQCQSFQ